VNWRLIRPVGPTAGPNASVARVLFLLTCTILWAAPVRAQEADPVDLILRQFDRALNAADRAALEALFGATITPSQIQQLEHDLLVPNAVRLTIRLRARSPLEGAPPGDGYSLIVEFFVETAGKARILTTGMDIRRPPGGAANSWRFVAMESLTSVEGLYKLRLNTHPLTAKNLEITSEDLVLTLRDGTVFQVDSDEGVTGLVLVGRGEMRFNPSIASERGQLRLFSGEEVLNTPFEEAFVRFNPSEFTEHVTTSSLTPAPVQERMARRAQDIFSRESPKSFSVDLQDLTKDTWHLLPPAQDFLADVDTRRFDTLTYSRSSVQAEDVSLFRRKDRRTIALYPSVAKLAARGRFYSDDALREYDVLDYNIEAAIDPTRQTIEGRARLTIRVRATTLSTVLLRLNEGLSVSAVTSVEYGRLLYLRMRSQNTVLVNLPRLLPQDSDLTLVINYAGHIPSEDLEVEAVQARNDGQEPGTPSATYEPAFLLSNRAFWYPQNPVPDYATGTIRINVPEGYGCVASGVPSIPGAGPVTIRDILSARGGKSYEFRAYQPLRYLAVVVSRFGRVFDSQIDVSKEVASGSAIDHIALAVDSQPGVRQRGRSSAQQAEDVLKFYTSLMGDAPYPSMTLALVESDLPGGHSPGYFAVIRTPALLANQNNYRGDPASFDSFPEFFIAHELAHQWWGQAVGWKNYHEQWLSEGFAQYFAALYAQKARGERTFVDMLRQFRRWGISDSDQGPISLGYRLGVVKSDVRVFRAVVYNKGAAVLHMLRRLLGDTVFFNGLKRFYADRRYQKAGTEDLERAFESESGRVLDRFFERWIYGTQIPKVRYNTAITAGSVKMKFEQLGDLVFDVPVTVTLTYASGRTSEIMVPLTEAVVEKTIPTTETVRQVQVNRDSAALAEFEEK
jgi:peptidase M1-like protein